MSAMRLLSISLFFMLGIFQANAEAALRFVPTVMLETFYRRSPEEASVARTGGGLRVIADLPVADFGVEFGALYANENSVFATGNVLKEKFYRGRLGIIYGFANIGALYFNARGGLQYNVINDTYVISAAARSELTSYKHLTQYIGLETELKPRSGFGLVFGATLSGNEALNKWISQLYFGITLD